MAVSHARCPHLGLDEIQGRAANRPHEAHRCWANGTPQGLSRREQAQRCLSTRWAQCPLLQPSPQPLEIQPAPSDPQNRPALPAVGPLRTIEHPAPPKPRISPVMWTAALAPFVAAAAVFGWLTWQTITSPMSLQSALAYEPPASASESDVNEQQSDPSVSSAEVTATPTEAAFIPLRAVEASESAPDVAAEDDQPATPVPEPTTQPTPIVTPGPFPAPASSPPTNILAPAIDLDAPVTEVGTYFVREGKYLVRYHEVAEYAAGWHDDSALPGAVGNTVLAGHNNTGGEVFRYVSELEPGDMVYLESDGRQYPYQVAKKMILPETFVSTEQQYQNARWIAPTDDRRLTLITCWPYVGNTHRVVVVALPFDTDMGDVARR